MINVNGTYTELIDGTNYEYSTRVFWFSDGKTTQWYNGINEPVEIGDYDLLMMLGNGTWFAHYKPKFSVETLNKIEEERNLIDAQFKRIKK